MDKSARRGYNPNDEKDFTGNDLKKLSTAATDFHWLLNRGYPVKAASIFVGNRFQLTERQRMAMVRAVSGEESIRLRLAKELPADALRGGEVHIDGFNTIITLEVALSGSPVLVCMDGVVRDLAGVRGSYRIIDKTAAAVCLILKELKDFCIARAYFYLDAPVSNSGRLKALIGEIAEECRVNASVKVINSVDRTLSSMQNVITSDAIILERCKSWFNLNAGIIDKLPSLFKPVLYDGKCIVI